MSDGQWASASGGASDVYIGNRLTYRTALSEGDRAFGPITPVTALIASVMLWILSFWIAIIPAAIIGVLFNSPTLVALTWLAVVVLVCLIPYRLWVSQWELTLDGKGAAAEAAYASIIGSLERDRIPVRIGKLRIRPRIGGPVRNYLVTSDGPYRVYIGVFPYGEGLFMTWSMWRTHRLVVIPWLFLWQSFRRAIGRGSAVRELLRTDYARALREAIHDAVREGVDAAAAGLDVDTSVLDTIPVEDEDQHPAPTTPRPRSRPTAPTSRPAAPPSTDHTPPRTPSAPSTMQPNRVPPPRPSAPPTQGTSPVSAPPPPNPNERID